MKRSSRDRQIALGFVLIAMVPIVVATVRALMHHWIPLGDDALVALRATDVFSAHPPLLGTAASASLVAALPLNHPGPLQFDVLAVPVALLGQGAGTAVGTALLNCASVATIGWVAWRRGGVRCVALGATISATLAWSMGSELLYDPWPPHSLLLPALAFFFLVWGVGAGDLVALPIAVGLGSLLVQTNLPYGYLVPALLAVSLALAWMGARMQRSTSEAGTGTERGRIRPVIVATLVVGLLCWTQPMIEQFTTSHGNLGRLVSELKHPPKALVGGRGAVRLTATVLARPPFWFRDSFANTFHPRPLPAGAAAPTVQAAGAVSTRAAVALLAIPIVVLGAAALIARRRRDAAVFASSLVGITALGVSTYTASRITTAIVGVAPHQFRFLWPSAAFVTFAIAFAVVSLVGARESPRRIAGRVVTLGCGAVIVVVAVWSLPTPAETPGPQHEEWAIPVMRSLNRQLGSVASSAPLLANWSKIKYTEPFSSAIMAGLRDRGIPFVTAKPFLVRQLGPGSAYNGHNARSRIFYREGESAHQHRIGNARRMAFHSGLKPSERRRLRALERQIGRHVSTDGLRVTPRIRASMKFGFFRALRGPFRTAESIRAVFDSGDLAGAVRDDGVDLPEQWRKRFEEYARLQQQADRETVGVFVGPVDSAVPKPS